MAQPKFHDAQKNNCSLPVRLENMVFKLKIYIPKLNNNYIKQLKLNKIIILNFKIKSICTPNRLQEH